MRQTRNTWTFVQRISHIVPSRLGSSLIGLTEAKGFTYVQSQHIGQQRDRRSFPRTFRSLRMISNYLPSSELSLSTHTAPH